MLVGACHHLAHEHCIVEGGYEFTNGCPQCDREGAQNRLPPPIRSPSPVSDWDNEAQTPPSSPFCPITPATSPASSPAPSTVPSAVPSEDIYDIRNFVPSVPKYFLTDEELAQLD
jgi:hypothetical protein